MFNLNLSVPGIFLPPSSAHVANSISPNPDEQINKNQITEYF